MDPILRSVQCSYWTIPEVGEAREGGEDLGGNKVIWGKHCVEGGQAGEEGGCDESA
jgi:hypothetical protein